MAEKTPLFTVTDRRKFTNDGELREGRPAEPIASPASATPEENFATPETTSTTGGPGLHLVGAEGKVDQAGGEEQEEPLTQSRNSGTPEPAEEAAGGASDGGLYESDPGAEADSLDADLDDGLDDGLGPKPSDAETAEQHEAYRSASTLIDTMVQQANPTAPAAVQMDFEQLVQSIYLSAVVAMGAGAEPGEKPRIDILGARGSIDMLAVLGEKTTGNLNAHEQRLMQSALFNLRMMFLELTNAIASQAQRGPASPQGISQAGPQRGPQSQGPQRPGPRR